MSKAFDIAMKCVLECDSLRFNAKWKRIDDVSAIYVSTGKDSTLVFVHFVAPVTDAIATSSLDFVDCECDDEFLEEEEVGMIINAVLAKML